MESMKRIKIIEDKTFMQHYWDLASENLTQRVNAAYQLIKYIQNLENLPQEKGKEGKSYQSQQEYLEYSLKRLIRGLGSPRDHARQGFAVAFSELIRVFQVDPTICVGLMDENLQVTGSSKGSEERDIMFGKLFGYVSLIRAGLLRKNNALSQELVERLIVLHHKKQWLQELTIETFLTFLSSADSDLQEYIFEKIQPLYTFVSFETVELNQLVFYCGLHHLAQNNATFKKLWQQQQASLSSKETEFNFSKLDHVTSQLLSSSRKFPKIHRIWDYLLGFIVPLTGDREFVLKDLEFTETQQEDLQKIIHFMDDHLWKGTKEKRALALKLAVKLIQVVPADIIPIIISESMVKSIFAARAKKNNLLYEFVGSILQEIVAAVEHSNARLLALITALTQIGGGANFDSRTNSTTIQSLVKAMNSETIQQYFTLLCSFVGKTNHETSEVMEVDETDAIQLSEVEDKAVIEQASQHPAIEALHAMIALSKHSNLENPNSILLPTASVLLRLASFNGGKTKSLDEDEISGKQSKKEKKDKKKKKNDTSSDTTSKNITTSADVKASIQAVQLLEQSFLQNDGNSVVIPAEVKNFAKEHVMNYLSNCLGRLISTVHPRKQKNKEDSHLSSAVPFIEKTIGFSIEFWFLIGYFFSSDLSAAAVASDDLDFHQYYQQVSDIIHYFLSLTDGLSAEYAEKKSTISKYSENSINLLVTVFSAYLIGNEVDIETLMELPIILKQLLVAKVLTREQPEEEGGEEEEWEVKLLDVSIELLAVNNEHSLKGVREILKRLWNNIFGLIEEERISQSFFDLLIESVVPSNQAAEPLEEIEDVDDNGESEGEDDDEAEADTSNNKRKRNDSKATSSAKRMKQNNEYTSSSSKQHADEEDENEDEEEDILLGDEDMLDLLLSEEDGENVLAKIREHQHQSTEDDSEDLDAEEKDTLLHFEEADEALIKMMKLRQETRKKGILMMKKQQYLLRSRLLDILEVSIHRLKNSSILFSFFSPLLKGYQSCFASNMISEIPEIHAFSQRLSQLILQQYCKKKIHLSALQLEPVSSSSSLKVENKEEEGVIEEFLQESQELLAIFSKLLISKTVALKTFGQETFYFFLKIIITNLSYLREENNQQIQSWIFQFLLYLLTHYYFNKSATISPQKSQLSSKLLDELFIHRYSNYFLQYRWKVMAGVENEEEKEDRNKKGGKGKGKKGKNVQEDQSSLKFVILPHLLEGIVKAKFFSKRLQIFELLNDIIAKQFSSTNKEGNQLQSFITASHATNEEFRQYLITQFLPSYLHVYREETKKIVLFSQEKFHPSKDTTTAADKSFKRLTKEYDTKNLRQYATLFESILSIIEELGNSEAESIQNTKYENELQELLKEFVQLQNVYQQASATSNATISESRSSSLKNNLSPVLVQSVNDIVSSLQEHFGTTTSSSVPMEIEDNDNTNSAEQLTSEYDHRSKTKKSKKAKHTKL